jgi:hypothetical protein
MSTTQGLHTTVLRTVNGSSWVAAVEDFDLNDADDIVWYSPTGALGDPLWWSTPGSIGVTTDTVH